MRTQEEGKHTPGPWRAEPCPCGHRRCVSGIVEPYVVSGQGACTMEDARLIAAAPDLLWLVQRARTIRAHEASGDWTKAEIARSWAAWHDDASPALSKAEGR